MKLSLALTAALLLAACGNSKDSHSPAYQTGRAAHEMTRGLGKVAKVMGRELEHGAVKAHEGWQDEAQRDKEHEKQKEYRR